MYILLFLMNSSFRMVHGTLASLWGILNRVHYKFKISNFDILVLPLGCPCTWGWSQRTQTCRTLSGWSRIIVLHIYSKTITQTICFMTPFKINHQWDTKTRFMRTRSLHAYSHYTELPELLLKLAYLKKWVIGLTFEVYYLFPPQLA